jgi:hypothetical protein
MIPTVLPKKRDWRVDYSITTMEELREKMFEMIEEIDQFLRRRYGYDNLIYKRAKAYWLAHIEMALSNETGYLGKSMVTMEDTIEEMKMEYEDEE